MNRILGHCFSFAPNSFLLLTPQGGWSQGIGRQLPGPRAWEGRPGRPANGGSGRGSARVLQVVYHWQSELVHQKQRKVVAMVMDQPKKGLGSRLLDKLVHKSAHYRMLKKIKALPFRQGKEENHNCHSLVIYLGLNPEKQPTFPTRHFLNKE